MTFAIGADDFYSPAIGIGVFVNSSGNLIVKTGPSTAGTKFVSRLVEWLIALSTDIGAGQLIPVKFTGKWSFGAFIKDHSSFFRR